MLYDHLISETQFSVIWKHLFFITLIFYNHFDWVCRHILSLSYVLSSREKLLQSFSPGAFVFYLISFLQFSPSMYLRTIQKTDVVNINHHPLKRKSVKRVMSNAFLKPTRVLDVLMDSFICFLFFIFRPSCTSDRFGKAIELHINPITKKQQNVLGTMSNVFSKSTRVLYILTYPSFLLFLLYALKIDLEYW